MKHKDIMKSLDYMQCTDESIVLFLLIKNFGNFGYDLKVDEVIRFADVTANLSGNVKQLQSLI